MLLPALFLLLALPATPSAARADSAVPTLQGVAGRWDLFPVKPTGRNGAVSAYDPVRKRMWLFGGYDGVDFRNDVWWRTLDGPTAWTPLTTQGGPPPARVQSSLVYDAGHDRLILYGGTTGGSPDADLWSLDLAGTPTWTQLAPAGIAPAPRFSHTALYDPLRGRMLVVGGTDGTSPFGDAFFLDLAGPTPTWSPAAAAGTPPAARAYASLVYDAVGDRAVLFGGYGSLSGEPAHALNDTWTLALAGTPTWAQATPAGALPPARLVHRASYDSVHGRMIVIGGYNGQQALADAWALDLAGGMSWSGIAFGGVTLGARMDQAQIYDPGADRVVVFAGRGPNGILNDDLSLSSSNSVSWPGAPSPRLAHKAAYDPVHHDMVVVGGWFKNTWYNDVSLLHLGAVPQWNRPAVGGGVPSVRFNHAMAVDPVGGRLMMFGGNNSTGYLNDTWQLTLGASPFWTRLNNVGTPPSARAAPVGVYDPVRRRFLVVGGINVLGASLDEIWSLSLDGPPTWSPLPTGSGPARYGHSVVYDPLRDRLLLFGGTQTEFSFYNDVWAYSFAAGAWSLLAPTGTPPPGRYGHEAIYDPLRDRMVVFGGYGGSFLNDLWELNLGGGTPAWNQLHPDGGLPSPRDFYASIYDPAFDRFVSYGGNTPLVGGPATPVDDTWILSWSGLPTPVLNTLIDATVDGARVHLAWYTPDGAGTAAQAERTADGAAWAPLGTLLADGSGRFTLDDVAPADGRWGYRLRVGARGTLTETTWLTTSTAVAALALAGATPNPAVTASVVAFSLRGGMPAALAVFDVRGRAVLRRDLSRLGAGAHSLALARGELGGAGVYVLRLTEGDRSLVRKLAVLP